MAKKKAPKKAKKKAAKAPKTKAPALVGPEQRRAQQADLRTKMRTPIEAEIDGKKVMRMPNPADRRAMRKEAGLI